LGPAPLYPALCRSAARMSSSMSPEQIRRLVDAMYATWTLHEPERVDALFTDDAVHEDVAGGHISRGKAEIKQLMRAAFAFASDFRSNMRSLSFSKTDAGGFRMSRPG